MGRLSGRQGTKENERKNQCAAVFDSHVFHFLLCIVPVLSPKASRGSYLLIPDRSNSTGAPRKLLCPAVHSFDLNTSVRPELFLELVVAALRTHEDHFC